MPEAKVRDLFPAVAPVFLFMKKENFIKLGKINKANRKSGELTIVLAANAQVIDIDLNVVFLEIDGGLVPFFISNIGGIATDHFRATIEDYDNSGVAQRLVGFNVYLPKGKNDLPNEFQFDNDELIGYEVSDKTHGLIGIIRDVVQLPEQTVLQIFDEENEILVPFVADFYISIDHEKKLLHLDLPDGLIDLYLDNG